MQRVKWSYFCCEAFAEFGKFWPSSIYGSTGAQKSGSAQGGSHRDYQIRIINNCVYYD